MLSSLVLDDNPVPMCGRSDRGWYGSHERFALTTGWPESATQVCQEFPAVAQPYIMAWIGIPSHEANAFICLHI